MYGIFDIANEILVLCKKRGISVSPLKLMKLTYIAFGWFAALRGERLFSARIEAWRYGPVMPNLYHVTKRYGRDPIPERLISDQESLDDREVREFLDEIVQKYGSLSAIQLSNITHLPDSPWRKAHDPNSGGAKIPFGLIKDHYIEKLDDGRQDTAA